MKQRLIVAALLLGPLVWLFGRAIVSDEMFVFRDAAHYYYPLYHYVAAQWEAGRVPLWNPQENLGQPLLADASAAVLYPGKLIFASPLGYDTNYKLYIVSHVLLAAGTAFAAARGFGRSSYAAALCALAYAYGGSVLFQYCNVVYLVGAAWLPLAALATDRALRERSYRWAIALGGVLALMTLGGDPQTAYHAGLAAALYAFILWRAERRDARATGQPRRPHRLILLGIAALALFVLGAVQILPSAETARRSTRAAYDEPRNIYEAFSSLGDDSACDRWGFLAGRTTPGQHDATYQFSVGPWHLAGFVWPNIFGRIFPTNTRWITALPAEGRTWTPTLYLGLLPLVLALSQLRFSFGRARLPPSQEAAQIAATSADALRIRWLSWLTLLALLASFGWYSLGWVASEIYSATFDGAEPRWGGPWGGVYWLLQSLLPGYAQFRYPAKWLVFVSLAMSLLAAYGFDALRESVVVARIRRWLLTIALASLAVLVGFVVMESQTDLWSRLAESVPGDRLMGPFDPQSAVWQIVMALAHTILVALAVWLLLTLRGRCAGTSTGLPAWRRYMLFVVVAIDLSLAQRGLLPTAPTDHWRTLPALASAISQRAPTSRWRTRRSHPPLGSLAWACRNCFAGRSATAGSGVGPRHVAAEIPLANEDRNRRIAQRAALGRCRRILHAQRRSSQGMTFEQFQFKSMAPLDYVASLQTAHRLAEAEYHTALNINLRVPDTVPAADVQWLELMQRRTLLQLEKSKADMRVAKLTADVGRADRFRDVVAVDDGPGLFCIATAMPTPRAWVVHDVVVLPELRAHHSDAIWERSNEVLARVRPLSFTQRAVVESDTDIPPLSPPDPLAPADFCRITHYAPERVEVAATLHAPGLLVLADAYDPNWRCWSDSAPDGSLREIPVVRANRILRGVWLPAGEHRIVFRYRPWSVYLGAIMSACGWIALAIGGSQRLALRCMGRRDALRLG